VNFGKKIAPKDRKMCQKTEKCAQRQKNAPKDRKMRPKTEKCAQRQKNAPKRRNFAKSGHTAEFSFFVVVRTYATSMLNFTKATICTHQESEIFSPKLAF
jgi:hypothetical protein